MYYLAGDVCGQVAAEKQNNAGNLFRFPKTAQRNGFQHFLTNSFMDGLAHFRQYHARRHGVDRYLPFGQFPAEHLGQAGDTPLGGGIIALPEKTMERGYRGHVHNAAAIADFLRRRFADVKCSGQVGVDHILPLSGCHFLNASIAQDTRIVDHDVNLIEEINNKVEGVKNNFTTKSQMEASMADYIGMFFSFTFNPDDQNKYTKQLHCFKQIDNQLYKTLDDNWNFWISSNSLDNLLFFKSLVKDLDIWRAQVYNKKKLTPTSANPFVFL